MSQGCNTCCTHSDADQENNGAEKQCDNHDGTRCNLKILLSFSFTQNIITGPSVQQR